MLYTVSNDELSARPVFSAQPRTLLTVQQFCTKHPAWTPGAVRNLIFHAQPRHSSRGPIPGNGLAQAIVRLGRKVLIDEQRFFAWLDSQQRGAV